MRQHLPSGGQEKNLRINFFRPRPGFMRREVTIIWLTLLAWAVVTFGFPIYLGMTRSDPEALVSSSTTIFGMPAHYWVSGQLLILWFILICFIFNVLIDWLTESYRKRR